MRKLIISTVLFFCTGIPVWAMMPHKTFLIKSYEGMDVLCGPYTVQKDDYIWDILKRKGVLSERNFPKFLAMFKQLNPHIPDPDRIYPGQHIIIPLRYAQSQGTTGRPLSITIPVIPDILYYDYRVKQGDSISKILARHYNIHVSKVTQQQLEIFERINPDIKDINVIYPGQHIHIPEVRPLQDLPQEQPLQIASVELQKSDGPKPASAPISGGEEGLSNGKSVLPIKDENPKWSRVVVSEALKPLGGDLICSGSYFFPTGGGAEHTLDLTTFPIVELSDGQRVLLDIEGKLSDPMKEVLHSFWRDLQIVNVNKEVTTQSVLEKIIATLGGHEIEKGDSVVLRDGISVILRGDWVFSRKYAETGELMYLCVTIINQPEESIPMGVQRYLARNDIHVIDILSKQEGHTSSALLSQKTDIEGPAVITMDIHDNKAFVGKLLGELGTTYVPETSINISYAGFDVELSVNLATTSDGTNLVVDFGGFYGDMTSVLSEKGIKTLTVNPDDTILTIAKNIVASLGMSFTEAPVFFTASRGVLRTVSLTIPGILISPPDGMRIFLTPIRLDPRVCSFLKNKSIKVLRAYRHSPRGMAGKQENRDKL